MKTKIILTLGLLSLLILNSCIDTSERVNLPANERIFRIELVNQYGQITHSSLCFRRVQREHYSAYYLADEKTGTFYKGSNTIIITEIINE